MNDTAESPTAAEAEPAEPRKRGGGPSTPEGKMRSRENALRHGLRSKILLPDHLVEAVGRRRAELVAEHRPASPHQYWLIGDMARASALLDHCHELRMIDLGRVRRRIEDDWDADRRLEVEELGDRLSSAPGRIVAELSRTAQGADWLIRRLRGLAEVARRVGAWDEAQRALAFDLLGTPAELRSAGGELPAGMTGDELAALVEGHAERLERRKAEVLDDRDRADREMAALGLPIVEDKVTARLRRYEAECRRTLKRSLDEYRRLRPESAASPAPRPAPRPRPKAEPRREPSGAEVFGELMADLMKPAPALPEPPAEAAPEPAPAPATGPPKPMSRRARKAMEKRQRLAAKRAGR